MLFFIRIVECDAIWLFFASCHLPDLVAAWFIYKVIIASCVWHLEHQVFIFKGIILPVEDSQVVFLWNLLIAGRLALEFAIKFLKATSFIISIRLIVDKFEAFFDIINTFIYADIVRTRSSIKLRIFFVKGGPKLRNLYQLIHILKLRQVSESSRLIYLHVACR